jgi:predicted phosphoribosyltransferase
MPFRNRCEAGRELATALAGYRDQRPVILALPRGGVPVAAEVATALAAPLDLILVRKIGVPDQPELAMGAVVDGGDPIIVRNEDIIELAGIGQSEFKAVCDRELAEIERRRQGYLGKPSTRGCRWPHSHRYRRRRRHRCNHPRGAAGHPHAQAKTTRARGPGSPYAQFGCTASRR